MNNFHIYLVFSFIGLILGSNFKYVINIKFKKIYIIYLVFLLSIIMFLNSIKLNIPINHFTLILIGILEAFTMIIPGLSGTSIFIWLGIYKEILLLFSCYKISINLICFSIDVVIGIFIFCKQLNNLINKYENTYKCLSFIISIFTSLLIIKDIFIITYSLKTIIVSIVLFLILFIISLYINN